MRPTPIHLHFILELHEYLLDHLMAVQRSVYGKAQFVQEAELPCPAFKLPLLAKQGVFVLLQLSIGLLHLCSHLHDVLKNTFIFEPLFQHPLDSATTERLGQVSVGTLQHNVHNSI